MRSTLLSFFLALCCCISFSKTYVVDLNSEIGHYDFKNYELFVDSTNSTSINHVVNLPDSAFKKIQKPLSLNYKYNTYWVRIHLNCETTGIYHFQTHYHLLNNYTYHLTHENSVLETQLSGNLITKQIKNLFGGENHYSCRLEKSKSYTLYLRAHNKISSIRLPLSVESNSFYQSNSISKSIKWAFFGGSMFLLFILGIFFFISHRDSTYLFYCLYNLSSALILLNNKGYFPVRLTSIFPGFAYYDENVFIGYFLLMGIFNFTIRFLKETIPTSHSKIHPFINVIFTLLFIWFCFFSVDNPNTIRTLAITFNSITMGMLLYIIYLIVNSVFRKYRPGYYYALAIAPFTVLLLIARLKKLLLLDEMAYSSEAFAFAIVFDSFFMLAGLSLKFKQYKEEKESLLKEKNKLQKQKIELSRKLHDNIGAQFTLVKSSIDEVKETYNNPKLLSLSNYVSQAISDLRNSIWTLNQEEDISLEQVKFKALDTVSFLKNSQDKIKIRFETEGDFTLKIDPLLSINLLSTINEAINNALKHSECSVIHISFINTDESLSLIIVDDGVGYNKENVSLGNGLKNMRLCMKELGADFRVKSDNKGTMISIKKNWND